jgi:proteasome lid subunit RPN8/RPN11
MIKIPYPVMRGIYDHMEEAYPYECCGLMIGEFNGDERLVQTYRKCKNLNTERPRVQYKLDEKCFLQVTNEFAGGPLEIVGIYHSHPDHPSGASQTDTEAAAAVYSYVIVSVQQGTVATAQSWVLNEVEKKMYEEPLEILAMGGDPE